MKECAYRLCSDGFEPKQYNQVYCCDEHSRLETNARIKDKYYETKGRKSGAVRICSVPGCGTKLSRYNEGKMCGKCEADEKKARELELKRLVTKQWRS